MPATRTPFLNYLSGLTILVGLALAAGTCEAADPPHADRDGFPLPAEAVARVGSLRLRCSRDETYLQYSPDGTLLAAFCDGSLPLWDARTGKLVREIKVRGDESVSSHARSVDGVFSADGKTAVFLTGSTCRWFDVRTGEEVRHLDLKFSMKKEDEAILAPRGETLVALDTNYDRDLVVFDLRSGRERFRRTSAKVWFRPLVFSPDGKTLAELEGNGVFPVARVRFLDVETGRELGSFGTKDLRPFLLFSPDGKRLFRRDKEGVDILSVPSGQTLCRIENSPDQVTLAAFAPDGSVLVDREGSDSYAAWIDPATGKELRRLRLGFDFLRPRFHLHGQISACAFAPDGKRLAVSSPEFSGKRNRPPYSRGFSISQWDVATGRRLAASAEVSDCPYQFSADGRLLWLGRDGYMALVDWQTGREIRRVPREGRSSFCALSPSGSRIAGTNADGKLTIWDAESGLELQVFRSRDRRQADPVFSADGKSLYVSDSGRSVQFLDVATGKEVSNFAWRFNITTLVASPDGRQLLTMDGQPFSQGPQRVWLRDLVGRGQSRELIPGKESGTVQSVAFSADGTLLAAIGLIWGAPNPKTGAQTASGSVTLWDARSGEVRFVVPGLADFPDVLSFSPDGRTLATGSYDGTVRLWEVASGKERHRFAGHPDGIGGILFSPDGKLLAADSFDTACLLWDVEGRYGKPPTATPFADNDAARLWLALQNPDAAVAFRAMRELLARPGPAVAMLRDRLQLVAADNKLVDRWLRDLDADAFAARERAAAELKAVANKIEPRLRKFLAEKPSAEAKRQIEGILESTRGMTPDQLLEVRSVEVLERLGTAEARDLLGSLARGAERSLLAREAGTAVERLKAR
jgi:WD40 repeat protein